jgi:hypothetical protein
MNWIELNKYNILELICGLQVKTVIIWPSKKIVTLFLRPYGKHLAIIKPSLLRRQLLFPNPKSPNPKYIPTFLPENNWIYSTLSIHIESLAEQKEKTTFVSQCPLMFPNVVIQILNSTKILSLSGRKVGIYLGFGNKSCLRRRLNKTMHRHGGRIS